MFRRALFILLVSLPAFTQQLIPNLGSTYSVSDVQLTGSATVFVGPESEITSIKLIARRDGKSLIDFGTRGELRINSLSDPQCFYRADGSWRSCAVHNSWAEANWFFPALSAIMNAQSRSAIVESQNSGAFRTHLNAAGYKPSRLKLIKNLSATEYVLDNSGLIVLLRYNTHPDDDFGTNIPVEVRFSDYRDISGVKVPFRIQRFLSGSPELDITISSVAINPGIPDSVFVAQ